MRGYSPLPEENDTEVSSLIEGFNIIYQSFQLQHTFFEKKDYSGVELGIDMVYFCDFGISMSSICNVRDSFALEALFIQHSDNVEFHGLSRCPLFTTLLNLW